MRIKIFWDSGALCGLEAPAGRAIGTILGIPVDLEENGILVAGYDRRRNQCDAQKILARLQLYKKKHRIIDLILLVTRNDLFVKGSDFVFGLAREPVGAAVISTARLGNEFYGRKGNDDLLISRVVTEGTHELGHLLGLDHCSDSQCIMFPPETLDQLDGKKRAFCPVCLERLPALSGTERAPTPDSST